MVSALVCKVATPFTRVTALPSWVAPSKKVTVPVGVPLPTFTVAVKVTALPLADGLAEEARTVEVVWVSRICLEMLPSLVEVTPLLPLYLAVIFWVPGLVKVGVGV